MSALCHFDVREGGFYRAGLLSLPYLVLPTFGLIRQKWVGTRPQTCELKHDSQNVSKSVLFVARVGAQIQASVVQRQPHNHIW